MEAADSVPEVSKRKKVRWEYVVEPLNKATYWDHAALPAEERRSKAKRVFLVAETKVCERLCATMVGHDRAVLI